MKGFLCFTGIDVSKAWLDVAVFNNSTGLVQERRIENDTKQIRIWLKSFYENYGFRLKRVLFCMEETGVYIKPFLKAAAVRKINVWVESPVKIKKSLGLVRGKTDKWDALRIAQYACRFCDKAKLWAPMSKEVAQLKAWLSKRQLLSKVLQQLNIEDKKDLTYKIPYEAVKATIVTLDYNMEELLAKNDELGQQLHLLKSIPGIGLQTAITLIVVTRGFTRLTDQRKLSCYAGIAPFPYQSGSSLNARNRISKIGDIRLKTLLSLAAWNAIRSIPDLKSYYERKVAEGKSKLSVTNALRNKIIAIAIAVIKRGTPFVNQPVSCSHA